MQAYTVESTSSYVYSSVFSLHISQNDSVKINLTGLDPLDQWLWGSSSASWQALSQRRYSVYSLRSSAELMSSYQGKSTTRVFDSDGADEPVQLQSQLPELLDNLHSLPGQVQVSLIPGEPISANTIEAAEKFIVHLYDLIIAIPQRWIPPHLATDGEGNVSFEWWRNNRSLTFFISKQGEVEYLRAWGPHIWHEMEEGDSPTDERLLALWYWLYN